jgi:hypothetical protein
MSNWDVPYIANIQQRSWALADTYGRYEREGHSIVRFRYTAQLHNGKMGGSLIDAVCKE